MNAQHDNCGNCRFFNPTIDNRQRGLCQRNPPQIVHTPDSAIHTDAIRSIWPEMVFEDWCGDFQPQAEQAKPLVWTHADCKSAFMP